MTLAEIKGRLEVEAKLRAFQIEFGGTTPCGSVSRSGKGDIPIPDRGLGNLGKPRVATLELSRVGCELNR